MSPNRPDPLAYAGAIGQTLIAIASFFVVRVALDALPWQGLAAIRASLAGLLFAGVLWWRWDAAPRGRDGWKAFLLGVIGVTLNQSAYAAGMLYTTPARAALLYSTTPLLVLLIGVLRGTETATRQRTGGAILAFVGVAVVLVVRGGLEGGSWIGDLLVLFGAVSWSAYSALGRNLLRRYDPMAVTAAAQIGGGLTLLPLGTPALVSLDFAAVPMNAWAAVAFLSVFTSFVAYSGWYYAIGKLPPTQVAVFMNLQPPITFLIGWWLGTDALSAPFLVGASMALGGVILAQRG